MGGPLDGTIVAIRESTSIIRIADKVGLYRKDPGGQPISDPRLPSDWAPEFVFLWDAVDMDPTRATYAAHPPELEQGREAAWRVAKRLGVAG